MNSPTRAIGGFTDTFEDDLSGWDPPWGQVQISQRGVNGTKAANFNGGAPDGNARLYRRFAATPGGSYLLAFDFGTFGADEPQQLRFKIVEDKHGGDTLLYGRATTSTGANPAKFTHFERAFEARSVGSLVLEIADETRGAYRSDGVLDKVSIVPLSHLPMTETFEAGLAGWRTSGNVGISQYGVKGSKAAHFNGAAANGDAVLQRTFAATPGTSYVLAFDFGVFGYNQPQTLELRIVDEAAGRVVLDETVRGSTGGNPVTFFNFSRQFEASGPYLTLTITDRTQGADSSDGVLDNLSIREAVTIRAASQRGPVAKATRSPGDSEQKQKHEIGFDSAERTPRDDAFFVSNSSGCDLVDEGWRIPSEQRLELQYAMGTALGSKLELQFAEADSPSLRIEVNGEPIALKEAFESPLFRGVDALRTDPASGTGDWGLNWALPAGVGGVEGGVDEYYTVAIQNESDHPVVLKKATVTTGVPVATGFPHQLDCVASLMEDYKENESNSAHLDRHFAYRATFRLPPHTRVAQLSATAEVDVEVNVEVDGKVVGQSYTLDEGWTTVPPSALQGQRLTVIVPSAASNPPAGPRDAHLAVAGIRIRTDTTWGVPLTAYPDADVHASLTTKKGNALHEGSCIPTTGPITERGHLTDYSDPEKMKAARSQLVKNKAKYPAPQVHHVQTALGHSMSHAQVTTAQTVYGPTQSRTIGAGKPAAGEGWALHLGGGLTSWRRVASIQTVRPEEESATRLEVPCTNALAARVSGKAAGSGSLPVDLFLEDASGTVVASAQVSAPLGLGGFKTERIDFDDAPVDVARVRCKVGTPITLLGSPPPYGSTQPRFERAENVEVELEYFVELTSSNLAAELTDHESSNAKMLPAEFGNVIAAQCRLQADSVSEPETGDLDLGLQGPNSSPIAARSESATAQWSNGDGTFDQTAVLNVTPESPDDVRGFAPQWRSNTAIDWSIWEVSNLTFTYLVPPGSPAAEKPRFGTVSAAHLADIAATSQPRSAAWFGSDLWDDVKKGAKKVEHAVVHVAKEAVHDIEKDAESALHFVVKTVEKAAEEVETITLQTVEDIATAAKMLVHAIEVEVEDVVKWLAKELGWNHVIDVMDGVQEVIDSVPTQLSGFLTRNLDALIEDVDHLKAQADATLDKLADDYPPPKPADTHSFMQYVEWIFHKMFSVGGKVSSGAAGALGAVRAAGNGSASANLLAGLEDVASTLEAQLATQVANVLGEVVEECSEPTALVGSFVQFARVSVDDVFDAATEILTKVEETAEKVLTEVSDDLSAEIDIPVLSSLYKLLTSNPLSASSLASLSIALPSTYAIYFASGEKWPTKSDVHPRSSPLTTLSLEYGAGQQTGGLLVFICKLVGGFLDTVLISDSLQKIPKVKSVLKILRWPEWVRWLFGVAEFWFDYHWLWSPDYEAAGVCWQTSTDLSWESAKKRLGDALLNDVEPPEARSLTWEDYNGEQKWGKLTEKQQFDVLTADQQRDAGHGQSALKFKLGGGAAGLLIDAGCIWKEEKIPLAVKEGGVPWLDCARGVWELICVAVYWDKRNQYDKPDTPGDIAARVFAVIGDLLGTFPPIFQPSVTEKVKDIFKKKERVGPEKKYEIPPAGALPPVGDSPDQEPDTGSEAESAAESDTGSGAKSVEVFTMITGACTGGAAVITLGLTLSDNL